jgi:hypothetical protein
MRTGTEVAINAALGFTTLPLVGAGIEVGSAEAAATTWIGYLGTDTNGIVQYVGITSRDALVRWAEHGLEDPAKALLNWSAADGAQFATKLEARVWEQTQINFHGLLRNGGTLINKINSIAEKYWQGLGIGN